MSTTQATIGAAAFFSDPQSVPWARFFISPTAEPVHRPKLELFSCGHLLIHGFQFQLGIEGK